MIKTMFKGCLMFGSVISLFTANAQFTMSGEIRPRTEYRHGFKTLADSAQKAAFFTDQRTRLNLMYKSKEYQMKIVFQDVRVWGNQSQLVKNEDFATSIHEAWGEVFISDKLSMKFGRQELVYDDHRIFGNVAWAQQARSHDALLFKYKVDSTFIIHVGGAFNQDKEQLTTTLYTVPKSYKALQYLWLHKSFSKNLGASVLFLNNGKQASMVDSSGEIIFKDNYSQTIGTRITHKNNKLVAHFVYYAQVGKDIDKADYYNNPEINAMLLGADVAYKVTAKLTTTIGFEYQSGQSQTDTTSSYTSVKHAFNPFYGTNHGFNGYMDYFYVGNWIGSVGLQDVFVKIKYNPEKFWAGADVHLFKATADVLDINVLANAGEYRAMNRNLGIEIDLTAGWKIAEGVDFKMGYSQMFGTPTLGILKGVTTTNAAGDIVGRTDQTSNWAWMMVTIKPVFIK